MRLLDTQRQRLLLLTSLAAITFNNWLLGFWLNPNLINHDGSVSELSAATQPHTLIFRTLDVTSGLLFVAAGALASRLMSRTKLNLLLIVSLITLGVANILDSLGNLQCAETIDKGCSIPISLSVHRLVLPSHAYTSVAIGLCYLVLPLFGVLYARRYRLRRFMITSSLVLAFTVASTASVMVSYAANGGPTVRAWGPSQEAQMLLLAAWVVLAVMSVMPRKFAKVI